MVYNRRYDPRKRSKAGAEVNPLDPGAFDALQAEEVDLRSRLWDQLRVIAYHSNHGYWKDYINAVDQLERILMGYLTLDSGFAREYQANINRAVKEYNDSIEGMPPHIKDEAEFRQRDWRFSKMVELEQKKEISLMIFLTKAGFFPRLALR